jgi:SAM-dependent methyltransferase
MVMALQRVGRILRPGGTLVSMTPHWWRRPAIAVVSPKSREPVASLINSEFIPRINAAKAALHRVVEAGQFTVIGTKYHHYRYPLASLAELERYTHLGNSPPRFPAGGRKRLQALWRSRPPGAKIEVTEWMVIRALRTT